MPIYEFVCSECNHPFEDLIFGSGTKGVVCPSCGSEQVKKKMSTFSSKVAGGGDAFPLGTNPAPSCNTGST